MKLRSLATWLLIASSAIATEPHAYHAAKLWPGNGPVIVDATLVVRDGLVVAVGKRAEVPIPAGAVVHNLGSATIIPGLIVAESSLADGGRDDLLALTPHYRAIDGFNWYADYSTLLAGGVTTVQIAPGERRLLPGQGAVVKLFGDDMTARTLRESESLRVILSDASRTPPRIYEPPVGAVSVDRPLQPTQPQLAASLSQAIAGLRATFAAARGNANSRDPFLRAVAQFVEKPQAVRVAATSVAEVQAALTLAREFQLRLILVNPPVTKDKLSAWKANVAGVVLNIGVRPGSVADSASAAPIQAARDLQAAGIPVALRMSADADIKETLYLAGQFTQRLAPVDVMKMLTSDAATVLGVGDRVGTLAAGKDADFAVLTGDPFAMHARVQSVHVEGEPAYVAPSGGNKVIRASRVLTGKGESIADGSILFENRTIRAVGREVSIPADAEEVSFPGAVIVPGFVDMGVRFGVGGPLTAPIAVGSKLGNRLLPSDPAIRSVRTSGTTTVLLSGPAPSSVLAFKLTDSPRVIAEPVALRFAVRGNLTSAGASLRETLRSAKAYDAAWRKYESDQPAYEAKKREFDAATQKEGSGKKDEKKPEPPKAPEKPAMNEAMEPFRLLFAGKLPALVEAQREDAIRLAVAICRDEFNLRTLLIGADDARLVVDLLVAKNVSVIAGPDFVRTVDGAEVNLPIGLALRSIPFAFHSEAAAGAKNLYSAVGFAVHKGLSPTEGLRGLTATPAEALGLDIGMLSAGKDADLVVLSGMPFEASTRVLAVMIDGKWVHRSE
jgi:imidazolonepropionase-like amidohydrolase